MKTFDTARQMPLDIFNLEQDFLYEMYELVCGKGEKLLDLDVNLEGLTGCTYHLVEEEEDLKLITTIDNDKNNRMALIEVNLFDHCPSWDAISIKGRYVVIFSGANNDGGPIWYIPIEIADQHFNDKGQATVWKSYARTIQSWNNHKSEDA